MNEQQFGKEVANLLHESTRETIKQSTLYRLQAARLAALEQCQFESESSKIIRSSSNSSVYGWHGISWDGGKFLLLLTILFILINLAYLQFWDADKYSAIDTLILADDLPVDAYIDNEFEEWLDLN